MRSFRVLTVTVVLALSLVTPNLFARVCHPKKPITCGATTLSLPAATAAVKATTVKTVKPLAKTQPMACGPWLRTFPYCAATPLVKTQPMACGPWLRTFPYCAGKTIG